jgi:PASTA domain-containing protein
MFRRATLLAVAVAALGAADAHANTITLGNPLTSSSYFTSGFSGARTFFNTRLIDGGNPASPVDGTVTSWAVGRPDGGFAFRVLREIGTGSYVALAGDAQRQLVFDPAPSPPQPTSLPIKKGDLIALVDGGGTSLAQANTGSSVVLPAAAVVGGPAQSPFSTSAANNYVFNATIRYCLVPSIIGKKEGAARSALAAADCPVGQILKPKKKAKRKQAKFVRSTSVPAGTAVSDTTPIDLSFGKKPKKKKHT